MMMWCAKRTLSYAFLIASCLRVFSCLGFAGDTCYYNANKTVCKLITDCQGAILDLRKRLTTPQICGFQGTLPMVCCVGDAPPITTTIPTKPPVQVGTRSLQKCDEYKIHAFNSGTQLRNDCPFDKLIIGGERAKRKEFPHMALIGFNDGDKKFWACGGTLISENYVLTAAHCLFSTNYGDATAVRLGDLNVEDPSDDENVQQREIKRTIPHPEYKPPFRYNDIGLLLLETPAELGIYVRPACLYTKSRTDTESAIVTGWDYTEEAGNWLMKVILQFFTAKRCKITYAGDKRSLSRGIDDESQVCFGPNNGEKDLCQGGGPVQVYSDTYCMYDIIGVSSFGKSCELVGIPAVYTRVYPYLKWIEDTVWP